MTEGSCQEDDRYALLEARVRDLEDREAIRDVIARYGFTADLNYFDEYVEQWAEDGEYLLGEEIAGRRSHRGRSEIRTFISDPDGPHRIGFSGRGSQHNSIDILVRVDGDRAWAECYSVVVVRTAPKIFGIESAAYNHWELRRIDGGWRIHTRERAPLQADKTEARRVMSGIREA